MPVLMNDFKQMWLDTEQSVLKAVQKVGASGWYILGEQVRSFEQALAAVTSRKSAIGCASGLDAIEIGLRACQFPPGGEVLTTPVSAFATTLAIIRAGGVPVFVDTDESGLIDLELVEKALKQAKAPSYFVPVHLYGHALNLDYLEQLKVKYNLTIIEDCAQAIGASFKGRQVGSVGAVSALSFYPTKNLGALGDGGAILTDDSTLEERCRVLRDYGQSRKYEHALLGLNSRLDEIQAAIIELAFLPKLAAWTGRRVEIASRYINEIDQKFVTVNVPDPESKSVWHLFPIFVKPELRGSLQAHLQKHGVQNGIHYPVAIPDQPALEGTSFRIVGEISKARSIANSELSIPINPYLTEAAVTEVIKAVNSWRPA